MYGFGPSVVVGFVTHERRSVVAECRHRKCLGKEVGDVEMRAQELHAKFVLTDVVTNLEVPRVQMFGRLCSGHGIVDSLSSPFVVHPDWRRWHLLKKGVKVTGCGVCIALVDKVVVGRPCRGQSEPEFLQQTTKPNPFVQEGDEE